MEYISNSTMSSNNHTIPTTANNSSFNFNNLTNFETNGYHNFNTLDVSHVTSTTSNVVASSSVVATNNSNNHETSSSPPPPNPPNLINLSSNSILANNFIAEADLSQLSLEIEKERTEYQEKSRHLQEQLDAFRHEIDELKVDDNVTTMDRLHRENQDQGNNKYSTIQKVKRGTTQSRVEIFEEL